MGDFACTDSRTAGFPANAPTCPAGTCAGGFSCWNDGTNSFCLQNCAVASGGGAGGGGGGGGGAAGGGGGGGAAAGCAAGNSCLDASGTGDFACLDSASNIPANAQDCSAAACATGFSCWTTASGKRCLQDCVGAGAGGGTGGAAGGGTGTGGGTGNSTCRTYATQFTVDISGGTHETSTHTAFFDVATLTYTDSWTATTQNTTTTTTARSTYASVADFVDMASSLMEGLGGPQRTTLTPSSGGSTTTNYSYDSQRRIAATTTTLTAPNLTFTAVAVTYTQWDAQGRATHATMDTNSPLASEHCTGLVLDITRDDSARSSVAALSGGTSASAFGVDNCPRTRTTSQYDTNLIMVQAVHVNPALNLTITDAWTTQSTATVCY